MIGRTGGVAEFLAAVFLPTVINLAGLIQGSQARSGSNNFYISQTLVRWTLDRD